MGSDKDGHGRGRFFGRRVVPGYGVSWPFGGNPPTDLERLAEERIRRLAEAELGTGNRVGLGIAVERRDGMTSGAERAKSIIDEATDHTWRVRFLSGSAGRQRSGLNELCDLVGDKRAVRRAARNSGLVPALERPWRWWIAAVAVAVTCAAIAGVLTRLAAKPGPGLQAAVTAAGLVAGAGIFTFIAQIITPEIKPVFGPRAKQLLSEPLESDPIENESERDFRDALRVKLARDGPKLAFIVDDLGRLWPRTRALVAAYLAEPGPRGQEQLWIIFERGSPPQRSGARAAREPLNAPNLVGLSVHESFDWWRCRQQPLTLSQKRALLGHQSSRILAMRTDPRLRYRGIGDVVGRPEDEQATAGELGEHLTGLTPSTVRAFALLACAANVPEPPRIRAEDITKLLRGSSRTQSAPIVRLLQVWLPGESGKPAAIHEAISSVSRDLEPFLEELDSRRGKSIQVSVPYADAFVNSYSNAQKEHGLPGLDSAHALWALYWHRSLTPSQGWSATMARLSEIS